MIERFGLERPVAEADLAALAAARGERDHLVGGKRPLGEYRQHFAAHIARGADHRDPVTHCQLRKFSAAARRGDRGASLLSEKIGDDNADSKAAGASKESEGRLSCRNSA